jgi:hypothetical protein
MHQLASSGATVVEYFSHDPKAEGLTPASGIIQF